jgi:hypothetical protein
MGWPGALGRQLLPRLAGMKVPPERPLRTPMHRHKYAATGRTRNFGRAKVGVGGFESRRPLARGTRSAAFRCDPAIGERRRGGPARPVSKMAIIDDYASIATDLRRIQAEKQTETNPADPPGRPAPSHRMRATAVGDLLYRRLVSRNHRPG